MSDSGALPSPAALERLAIATGRAAAALIDAADESCAAVRLKTSPTDVVTQTDLNAEELIRNLLLAETPDAGVLGEEGGGTAPEAPLQWIIDPLDGTVNFLYGVPLFAVSIAAAVDGAVVAGAVVDICNHEVFSAHRGGGARRNGEPIAVSTCGALAQALVATGFSYRAEIRANQGAVAQRLLPRARDLRCFGSTAIELCSVACGRVDAYYQGDTAIWDRAAGALIAVEAGARAELPCPDNDDLVIASTPAVYEELRETVLAGS